MTSWQGVLCPKKPSGGGVQPVPYVCTPCCTYALTRPLPLQPPDLSLSRPVGPQVFLGRRVDVIVWVGNGYACMKTRPELPAEPCSPCIAALPGAWSVSCPQPLRRWWRRVRRKWWPRRRWWTAAEQEGDETEVVTLTVGWVCWVE